MDVDLSLTSRIVLSRFRVWPLLPMILLTTAVPLAIHAKMITMGIPDPAPLPGTSPVACASDACTTAGVLLLLSGLGSGLQRRPAIVRVIVSILLVAGMAGHLFREPFMDMINTASPVVSLSTASYLFHDALKLLPLVLIVTLSAAALGPGSINRRGLSWILLRAVAIATLVWLAVGFVVDPVAAPTAAWLDAHAGNAIEQLPYDNRILIPAYATFLENAISTIVVVALVWDRLPEPPFRRVGAAAGLALLLIGPLVRPIAGALTGPNRWIALLSSAQFTLETLALGSLAALTCMVILRPPLSQPPHRSISV